MNREMHYEVALTDSGNLVWYDPRYYIICYGIYGFEWVLRCKWFPVKPGQHGMVSDGPAIFIRYP